MPREIRDKIEREAETVLHHGGVDKCDVAARASADGPPDRVDRRRNLLRRFGRGALVEQRGRDIRHTRLVGGILRAASPQNQPERDRGLLVVRHRDHLKPVRKRTHLVGRERNLPCRQRAWRSFSRPVQDLSSCGRGDAPRRDRHPAPEAGTDHRTAPPARRDP